MAKLEWWWTSDAKAQTAETIVGKFHVYKTRPGRYRVQTPDGTYLESVYGTMDTACSAVQGIHDYLSHHTP